MTKIDLFVAILLAIFFILGFRKGIITEIILFIGFFIAIVGSMSLTTFIISKLNLKPGNELGPYISYFIVFISIFIVVLLLGKMIEKLLKIVHLNFINRLGGGLLGMLKIIFLISLIFWLSSQVSFINTKSLEKSFFYRPLRPIAPETIRFATHHLRIAKNIIDKTENFFESKLKEEKH